MGSPVADADYLKEIEKVRKDLRAIMLRLGWPDAGTYDVNTKSLNGSVRHEEEQTQGSKAGLKLAINLSGPLKTKPPKISYADLYQLAGTVAVEVTGGPTIEFVPGRCDSSLCPQEGCLPDVKEERLPDAKEEWLPDAKEEWSPDAKQVSSHLRDIFYRMGLSDKDIVAISGFHAMGRVHPERSGNNGAGSEPLKFDNSYFVELLCREREGLLKVPTDKALLIDPEFRFYVEQYAKDKDLFFKDYAEAHKKLSEPQFNPRHADPVTHVDANSGSILGQSAVGVAVAAAVVILSYIYEVSRRI